MLFNLKRNQQGYSLIEMMVTVCMVAIALLGMGTIGQLFGQQFRASLHKSNANNTVAKVRLALSNRRTCERNFVDNRNPKMRVRVEPALTAAIDTVRQFDNLGNVTAVYLGDSSSTNEETFNFVRRKLFHEQRSLEHPK